MLKPFKRPVWSFSILLVPFLTLLSPSWLSLGGVGPCWAVLWLLPWSLEEGMVSSVAAGLVLGLLLDAISAGGPTPMPVLIALGFWWGWLGKYGSLIEGTLNLGLLAWIGSVFYGLSLWLQIIISNFDYSIPALSPWALQTLLIQATLTAVVAPLVSSRFLVLLRNRKLR